MVGVLIGMLTLAMMKTQRNPHCSPSFNVRDCVPYVTIGEPLTALSPNSCLCFWSAPVEGSTLTSVPVLTRKQQSKVLVKNIRQLCR